VFFARQREDSYECLYLKVLLRSVMLVLDKEEEAVLRVPKCCPQKLPSRLEDRCCPIRNTEQNLQVPTSTSSHQRKSIQEETVSGAILRWVIGLSGNQWRVGGNYCLCLQGIRLTLSEPTSNLVRQYDFPVPLRCRKMSDTVFVAFVCPLSEHVRRFFSCSTDFSQQIAQVVLFLFLYVFLF
jgi:hypothetical protein